MVLLVVLAKQVVTEIVFQISNDAVHVICPVLSVVVLDQKVRSLNAVVVAFPDLEPGGERSLEVSDDPGSL